MAGRGAPTFLKRQKEQNRKEKREAKLARRQERSQNPSDKPLAEHLEPLDGPPNLADLDIGGPDADAGSR